MSEANGVRVSAPSDHNNFDSLYGGRVERQRPLAKNISQARQLRKAMSLPETLLWARLRGCRTEGIAIRRQVPYKGFVMDFAHLPTKVALEIDGRIHEHTEAKDLQRQKLLEQDGWIVIRYSAKRVLKEPDEVAEAMFQAIKSRMDGD